MIALVVYVDDIVITGDDGLGMSINSVCDENDSDTSGNRKEKRILSSCLTS